MCRILKAVLLGAALLGVTGCNLYQGTPTAIPTPNSPRIEFRFPPNNSTIVEGAELNIELLAVDPGAGVARVELLVDDLFYRDGKPQVSASVPTFTVIMNWLAQGVGQHSLTAVAYRNDGTASPAHTIVIQVLPRSDGG